MLKVTKSMICDNCEKELITESAYPHKFTLELSVIDTNVNTSGMTYCVHMEPPFQGKKHFCNSECLSEYFNKDK